VKKEFFNFSFCGIDYNKRHYIQNSIIRRSIIELTKQRQDEVNHLFNLCFAYRYVNLWKIFREHRVISDGDGLPSGDSLRDSR